MAGICCGVVGEAGETASPTKPTSRPFSRRSLDQLPLKYIAGVAIPAPENPRKRQKLDQRASPPRECQNAVQSSESKRVEAVSLPNSSKVPTLDSTIVVVEEESPRYGVTSVCGRRRDMEDAVSVHPSFCLENRDEDQKGFHFFAVFDGHGCSHVASMCKERLHEIVKEEIQKAKENLEWESMMKKSFARMDQEVQSWSRTNETRTCRCELQTPRCDAVGSTAVVAIVTPEKIIVANCGDSRAVLCRNRAPVPLSDDHKPDRPDELLRIEDAGGRVIYWDGPRVLGVLAMSRAIGDNYLKPYVISEPEVTVTERSEEDECLILGSDGLWDTVQNDTACKVARMCLNGQKAASPGRELAVECSDKACSDASILLTKLALVRHSSDNVSVVVVDLRRDDREQ
ncbi:hypothetical protein PHAVU_008G231200 [Phaseolus vulgaris]|uniref:protein-serine/threonine phosphatase n=1 Tax=Phaseolus vulgaris TaxID=3885 RepID=V7B7I9_PHAVU|nr:hypothetical protein PHAVU_008G231200g [Phaseolus vulgaris]ESW13847.1 hypothetical protein PHAVU_008G231200g [Phaseolus vulgaris]